MANYDDESYNNIKRDLNTGHSKWDLHPDTVVVHKKSSITPSRQMKPALGNKTQHGGKKGEIELVSFKKPVQVRPAPNTAQKAGSGMTHDRKEPIETVLVKKDKDLQAEKSIDVSAERSKKSSVKKAAAILSAVLIVCILGVLVFQLMRINEITVDGLIQLSDEYVISYSGIKKGSHIFGLDEASAERRINSDPRMEFQSITYEFPDKLIIHIKECVPAACFYADGQYVVIDMNGKVLGLTAEKPACALVNGINAVSFPVGQGISTDNEYSFSVLKELLSVFDKYGITSNVIDIDFESTYSIGYKLYTGMNVKLGTKENFDKKVYYSIKVNERLAEMGNTTGTIDISYGDQAIYSKPYTSAAEGGQSKLNYNLSDFDGTAPDGTGQDDTSSQGDDSNNTVPSEDIPSEAP